MAMAQSAIDADVQKIANARAEIAVATEAVGSRQASVNEAKATMSVAQRAVARAEGNLDFQRRRAGSIVSATDYLAETNDTISDLRRQLNALENTPENASQIDVLERQIRAINRQLSRQATEYASRNVQSSREFAAAEEALKLAKQKARSAEDQYNLDDSALDGAKLQLAKLNKSLADLLEKTSGNMAKLAPGFVREITITQNGKTMYQARWDEDDTLGKKIKLAIKELEREIKEVNRVRVLVNADMEVYRRDINAATQQVKLLNEERGWNQSVILWSERLYYFGEVVALAATGAGIVSGVRAATLAAVEGGTAVTARFVARETVRQTALQLSFGSLPSVLEWPGFALRGKAWLQASSSVLTAEKMLLASKAWVEPVALIGTVYQNYSTVKGLASSPSTRIAGRRMGSIQRELEVEVERIRLFKNQRLDFIGAREARRSYALSSAEIIQKAYNAQYSKIRNKDKSFWRTIKVGKIFTSDAEIAVAYATLEILRSEAQLKAAKVYLGLTIDERNKLDATLPDLQSRLQNMREKLPGAPVRVKKVLRNRYVKIGDELSASISIEFTQALKENPLVKIGTGTISRPPAGADDSEGLPLPGPDKGAVLVQMSGAGKSWSGTFYTAPLSDIASSNDPIQIEINAKDLNDRALDADPQTATFAEAGGWGFYEATPEGASHGNGGPDKWHHINGIFMKGSSYVFVIDASGSMGDNTRMVQVKRSARTFLSAMEKDDEVAIWAFYDCGNISLAQSFTRDKKKALAVINGIEPSSGTPLAAAIGMAGEYLLTKAHFGPKSLIILSDGAESCDGDPASAAALFRRQVRVLGNLGQSNPDGSQPPRMGQPVAGGAGPANDNQPANANPSPGSNANENPDEAEPEDGKVVKVKLADIDAWNLVETGGTSSPIFALQRTRYHETGKDGACTAEVTRETYYANYTSSENPDKSIRVIWRVNRSASKRQSLAVTRCASGQKSMNAFRKKWKSIKGVTEQQVGAQLEARVQTLARGG